MQTFSLMGRDRFGAIWTKMHLCLKVFVNTLSIYFSVLFTLLSF